MIKKTTALGLILMTIVCTVSSIVYAGDTKLQVTASSSFFANLVQWIGGDNIAVKTIASPKFNVHFYQPTPKDIRNVRKADLYVHWGLDLEAWSDPLLEASGKSKLFRGRDRNLDLSQDMALLNIPDGPLSRHDGDVHVFGNPHYHLNPMNLRIMANTIVKKLEELDPGNASNYQNNHRDFLSRLDKKIIEWKDQSKHCKGKVIIAYHDDMSYLTEFMGIRLEQFVEPKPGISPTPQHMEFLETYAKENDVRAIALSSYFPKDSAQRIAERIGAKVVIIAHNAGEIKGTEDIFDFFDFNVSALSEGLR
ncbi:MAG: zinc/manganese transport system substrate-binding protein [Candidatus Omnitrophota bacterium]|jgi:zinc/manganese transport system substrate-binding protein